MSARLTLLTAGHLATCPRMVKAADALSEAGHAVHVVSCSFVAWARAADDQLARNRPWRWTRVPFERSHARIRRFRTALATRTARRRARKGADTIAHRVAVRAYAPYEAALVRCARSIGADLVYGGTTGGFHAAYRVAQAAGVPFGVDLEDFHVAEQRDDEAGRLDHALADRLLTHALPRAAFRTAAGQPIADAYASRYGLDCVSINNVFPRSEHVPLPRPESALRLYWFSQTLGPGRGLEDVVEAAARADVPVRLTLRGRALSGYLESLRATARQRAPRLVVDAQPPGMPDDMVALCTAHEVGLALEQVAIPNRDLCLTNKLFAFIAAGRPIIGTATTAQRPILASLGAGAKLVPPGDVAALAEAIRGWQVERDTLAAAGAHVARAAQDRWHWEHEHERGRLVRTVERALR